MAACCSARPPSWPRRRPRAARPGPRRCSRRGWRWCRAADLLVELVCHRLGGRAGAWAGHVAPPRGWPSSPAVPAHDGADQRGALRRPDDAPTVDVLDAARRLVPLGSAGLRDVGPDGARGNAEGFLKTGKQMHEVADEISRACRVGRQRAGGDAVARPHAGSLTGARSTRAPTSASARCTSRSSGLPDAGPARRPSPCCAPAARRRSAGATAPVRGAGLEAARRRARGHRGPGLRVLLPDRRRRHRPDRRDGRTSSPRAGPAPAAWSTTCSASPGSTRSATAC